MAIVYEGFGNVLTHQAHTLVCPVNVVGVMGAGLARAFRNRVHGLNETYKRMCENGDLAVGRCAVYPFGPGSDPRASSQVGAGDEETLQRQVLLFPTKGHWKDNSKLSYIEEGLQDMVKRQEEFNLSSIAMPPIGCGLGKLDYQKEVRPLIEQYLGDLPGVDVYLLLRNP